MKDLVKSNSSLPLAKRECVSPIRHPHIQRNLQKFKRTFQKPCQIYKFLKEVWATNPLFLNRNLSYVSKFRNRRVRKRAVTLSEVVAKIEKIPNSKSSRHGTTIYDGRAVNSTNGSHVRNCIVRQKSSGAKDCPEECDIIDDDNGASKGLNEHVNNSSIFYFKWICDDAARTSQVTRSHDLICPWCDTKYMCFESLMYHLTFTHTRFKFSLSEEDGQPVIEMSLNPAFDGSYCGFKYPGHDLHRDFKFSYWCPSPRVPLTQVIYFRPKKRRSNFNSIVEATSDNGDFAIEEGEADIDVCSGRLYYHTTTCLPVKPNEIDIDSEADMDPEWLRERTKLMIDEFTDVNEGEKEILKMWNLHLMQNYKYKGDNMIRQACFDFVALKGQEIIDQNLRRNFILHLANLYDFGLLGSRDLLECVRALNECKKIEQNQASKSESKVKIEHCQNSSPAKRALSSSQIN